MSAIMNDKSSEDSHVFTASSRALLHIRNIVCVAHH